MATAVDEFCLPVVSIFNEAEIALLQRFGSISTELSEITDLLAVTIALKIPNLRVLRKEKSSVLAPFRPSLTPFLQEVMRRSDLILNSLTPRTEEEIALMKERPKALRHLNLLFSSLEVSLFPKARALEDEARALTPKKVRTSPKKIPTTPSLTVDAEDNPTFLTGII